MHLIRRFTILDQDCKALVHQKIRVEDDKSEAQWQDIITRAHFEESSNALLSATISISVAKLY